MFFLKIFFILLFILSIKTLKLAYLQKSSAVNFVGNVVKVFLLFMAAFYTNFALMDVLDGFGSRETLIDYFFAIILGLLCLLSTNVLYLIYVNKKINIDTSFIKKFFRITYIVLIGLFLFFWYALACSGFPFGPDTCPGFISDESPIPLIVLSIVLLALIVTSFAATKGQKKYRIAQLIFSFSYVVTVCMAMVTIIVARGGVL